MKKTFVRLSLIALVCLSCASCVIARRSADQFALRDVGLDLEKALQALEQRGYQCSQNSFTAAEQSFFERQKISPLKNTCVRQSSALFCVESDFVDLFAVNGRVVNGRAEMVPICIWH